MKIMLVPTNQRINDINGHTTKGKYGIETCILSCKKRIASLCPMQDTGCLGLVHRDDPERCYGEGGGRGIHVWGFMSMYGKTNTVL